MINLGSHPQNSLIGFASQQDSKLVTRYENAELERNLAEGLSPMLLSERGSYPRAGECEPGLLWVGEWTSDKGAFVGKENASP